MSAPKWSVGMQRLRPGVYLDATGALHIDECEICESQGVPADAENCAIVRKAFRNVFKDSVAVTVVEVNER